jgi:hypothetical protein
MSITVGNVTTAASNVYVSAGATAITFMSLCNYSAGNVTANVYVVPSGGSVGNANVILASIELTALDTYQLYAGGEKLLLDTGDTVKVNANTNNAITTVVSYTTI